MSADANDMDIHADDIFSQMSKPMVAAVKAARQVMKGEAPDDELKNTESALAAHFSVEMSDRLRYDYRRRCWMQCERGIWREDRTGGAMRALQGWAESRLFEQVAAAATRRDMQEVARVAKRALSARALKNLLELAASQAAMADGGDEWDADPWLIVTKDGTAIDLRTGASRAATPNDRVTLPLGVAYDKDQACPTFDAFVRAICSHDEQRVRLIQTFAGYSLTGGTSEQKFAILIGSGANGKSTLLEILAYVMGELSAVLPFSALMRDRDTRSVPVEVARLPGRRFVRASELRGGSPLDEGRIKALTGGDVIMARGLYQAPFEFRPCGKLWLACNKLPRVDDRSHGFWRRALVIPFERTFDGADRDDALPEKLQSEGPGILNWIIEGARVWQRDGLPTVTAVEAAKSDWRESQDIIGQWADGVLVACPGARLRAADAYRLFSEWATAEGMSERDIPKARSFGEWMGERFTKTKVKSGAVYAAKVVGDGLEADPGNPPTRAHEESVPKSHHTHHPPPSSESFASEAVQTSAPAAATKEEVSRVQMF